MSTQGLEQHLPVQLYLPMFAQHEIDAWAYEEQQRLQKSLKRKPRVATVWVESKSTRSAALDGISDSLLDLPLGPQEDVELKGLGDPYAESVEDAGEETCEEKAEPWSETAVAELHEGMLLYSLRLLNTRGNGKEKKDLLRWMFDPEAMAYRDLEVAKPLIVWKKIKPEDVPFGFELCCRMAGYDADRLREGLGPVLKNLGLGALFEEIENARINDQNTRAAKVQHSINIQHARGAGKGGNSGGQGPNGERGTNPERTENRFLLRV